MNHGMVVKNCHISFFPLDRNSILWSIHICMKHISHTLPGLFNTPPLKSIESNRCEKHSLASSSLITSHQGPHYLILLFRHCWKRTEAREPIRIQLEVEERVQVVVINAFQPIHFLFQIWWKHGIGHDRIATTFLWNLQTLKSSDNIGNKTFQDPSNRLEISISRPLTSNSFLKPFEFSHFKTPQNNLNFSSWDSQGSHNDDVW